MRELKIPRLREGAKKPRFTFVASSAVWAKIGFNIAMTGLFFPLYLQLLKPFLVIGKFEGRFAVHVVVGLLLASVH